jgi:arylsulfatase A-like enzyme
MASCGPSRASFLTGMRPDVTGIFDNSLNIRTTMPDVVTLPQQFKNHGYHTQSFGKVFHGIFENEIREDSMSWSVPAWRPKAVQYLTERGLDTIEERYSEYIKNTGGVWEAMSKRRLKGLAWEAPDFPENEFTDGKIADKVIEAIKEMKAQPFFLAVGFTKPHLPFVAPKKYYDLHKNNNNEVVSNRKLPSRVSALSNNDSKELRGYSLIDKSGEIPGNKVEDLTIAYNACVSFIDAQIGKILDVLDDLNISKNTIVILCGDHGYHLGHQGLWGKNTNFETAVRVPLIISGRNDLFNGKESDLIVELLDIMPTLCSLAGIPVPEGVQGVSLLPYLEGSVKSEGKTAVSQHPGHYLGDNSVGYMGYSLRTDQYRYTEWIPKSKMQKTEIELYDFGQHPEEMINVGEVERYTTVQKQLSKKLHEIIGH